MKCPGHATEIYSANRSKRRILYKVFYLWLCNTEYRKRLRAIFFIFIRRSLCNLAGGSAVPDISACLILNAFFTISTSLNKLNEFLCYL